MSPAQSRNHASTACVATRGSYPCAREAAVIKPAPIVTASEQVGRGSLLRTRLGLPVGCRSAAILLALFTFSVVVCHARLPRPDGPEAKSCETELAFCQALLGTVGGKDATGVLQLTVAPSSKSRGRRSHAAGWPSHARTACSQPGPCAEPNIGKNASGTVPPADRELHPESSATSCAARLRECRARSIIIRRSTVRGEPTVCVNIAKAEYTHATNFDRR